jgi:DNA polymerase III sliding clamp (beta) subunit (PCNA family)
MDISHPLLLTALKTAEAALSSRPEPAALRCFWFTGTTVRATDGFIGIEVPLETDFKGGVPGKVLLGFIASMNRKMVKVVPKDKTLVFSAGRSRIVLPLNTDDVDGVWQFDGEEEHQGQFLITDDWKAALRFCSLCVTNNTTDDERRGLTFAPEGKSLNVYATDSASMAWAQMDMPDGWEAERVPLPGEFIHQVLQHTGDTDVDTFHLYESTARAVLAGGVEVHTLFLNVASPTNFQNAIKRYSHNMEPIRIPATFGPALERAALLKDDKDGVVATLKFGEEKEFRVEASSSFGNLKERVPHEGEHSQIIFKVDPEMVLRALNGRETMIAGTRCLTLVGPDNFTYMVAASS